MLSLHCISITAQSRGIAVVKEVLANLKKSMNVTCDKSTTYKMLLKQLNLLSPLNQRIVKMATGVHKAIHGYKVPRGIGGLLHEQSTNYNLRGKHILELPKVNTTTYALKSWHYTAAKIWNALPDQFRATNKIGTLKT